MTASTVKIQSGQQLLAIHGVMVAARSDADRGRSDAELCRDFGNTIWKSRR